MLMRDNPKESTAQNAKVNLSEEFPRGPLQVQVLFLVRELVSPMPHGVTKKKMPSYMLVFAWFLSLPSLHCEMSKAHRTTKRTVYGQLSTNKLASKLPCWLCLVLVGDAVFTSRTT